jgi:hypothetical protein
MNLFHLLLKEKLGHLLLKEKIEKGIFEVGFFVQPMHYI